MVQRRPDLFAVSLREAFEGSRRALFHEQQQVRVERDVPELATPAFLFQGKDGCQVATPGGGRDVSSGFARPVKKSCFSTVGTSFTSFIPTHF